MVLAVLFFRLVRAIDGGMAGEARRLFDGGRVCLRDPDIGGSRA